MGECNEYIEKVYLSPEVEKLIKSIRPEALQDDLRQEMAIALLSIDCGKITQIWASNGLLGFTIKIISNMAFSNTSQFFTKYRKNDYQKAINYLKSQVKLPTLNNNLATIANEELIKKFTLDQNKAHEAILFNYYVDVRSCDKVAKYFGLPEKHVKDVIRKVKKELKTICISNY
jgi:hypothetical protein